MLLSIKVSQVGYILQQLIKEEQLLVIFYQKVLVLVQHYHLVEL